MYLSIFYSLADYPLSVFNALQSRCYPDYIMTYINVEGIGAVT